MHAKNTLISSSCFRSCEQYLVTGTSYDALPSAILYTLLFFLIRIVGGGVHTGSTRLVDHFWPIVPAPGDCEDGEFGGMKIGMENRSSRRKLAPASPQIPFYQTRMRTRAAAVGSQRLTT
jgi:hypothetical protein